MSPVRLVEPPRSPMRSRYGGPKQALPAHAGMLRRRATWRTSMPRNTNFVWGVEETLPPKPKEPEGIVCSHRESQGLIDQTKGKKDSEIIHDKTDSTPRQIAGTILLPGKWDRLPQALHTTQERCSHLQIFNLTLSTELSRLLFVINEDVQHEKILDASSH